MQPESTTEPRTRSRAGALDRWLRCWWAVLVVCLPIAWASVRAAAGRWVPSGDDAYFTVRSRDVLTVHHPLLGAWSSGSTELVKPINNLGPIQLDLLAPFTRWTPMGGTAIGVACSNIAAVATIAWLVHRLLGRTAVPAAMAAVGLVAWTMGSEMLITPRQHQFLVLPFFCLLVAAWSVAAGDRWAIVPAVAAGSLVAQTHLSYPVLVAVLVLAMVTGQLVACRRGEARGGSRPFVVSGVLAVVLWAQTLVDQVFGLGNLGDVLFGSGDADRAGFRSGARIVAGILVSPDAVLRPGFRNHDLAIRLAGPAQSLVLWSAVLAAVVFVASGWRRRAWRTTSGGLIAVVAVLAGVLDATLLPVTKFGLTIMNYRWLWSLGGFLLLLALVSASRAFDHRRPAQLAWVGLCVVPALANLPGSMQQLDARRYLSEQANVAEVLDQLDRALDADPLAGPVVIDESAMYFGHPYTYPVMVTLQEHHAEIRFDTAVQERRFGARRLADGRERLRMRLVSGMPARELAASGTADLLAFVDGERPVAIVLESERSDA
jgi:hypothetical protein